MTRVDKSSLSSDNAIPQNSTSENTSSVDPLTKKTVTWIRSDKEANVTSSLMNKIPKQVRSSANSLKDRDITQRKE